MKKIKMTVNGRVQGSVDIEAVGPGDKIDTFIAAVKRSPSPSGKVDSCSILEDANIENYISFRVTN